MNNEDYKLLREQLLHDQKFIHEIKHIIIKELIKNHVATVEDNNKEIKKKNNI